MSGWILDGIDLPTIDVQDNFSNAVEKRSFPFKNAQSLRNMGIEERIIRIGAVFFGSRYDEHKTLQRAILDLTKDSHELVHPDLGLLRGQIQSYGSSYDEKINHVTVTIEFLVDGNGDEVTEKSPVSASVKSNVQSIYSSGQEDLKDGFSASVKNETGSEGSDLVETEVDDSQTLLDQFTSASETARAFLGKIDDAIEICENTLADIVPPDSSFIATIEYGSYLPGRFVKAVADALDRIATGLGILSGRNYLESLKNAYAAFAARFANDGFDARDQVDRAISLRYAMDCATVYDADNSASLSLKSIEEEPGFDVAGNRVVIDAAPDLMTINDLEETLYAARELLQGSIDSDRERSGTYKDAALKLLQHVETVRLDREKIVAVTIASVMPLHSVCLKYGLPVGYADRILAINPQIKNPTFVSGEIKIYAR